jgi:2-polyprenyl-3-methyl-5-hydroxy-6-metoxy-1,4-benzoquinol methylase
MVAELTPSAAEARGYHGVVCNQCGADDPQFRYKLVISSIVTCRRCGLSYVNPRAGTQWLESKLEQWAKADTVDEERLRIAFDGATMELYARHLEQLRRVSATESSEPVLLDVGCSVGAFLTKAASAGYRVEGLEIGGASAAYASRERGLDVTRGSVYEARFAPAAFDAVAMLEVIEHLGDPKAAFRRVAAWLKPGGALLLTTPNFDSLYRRMHGARWWVVNCEDEHIYFFTIDSLAKMAAEVGFDVRFVATRGFDIQGLLKQCFKQHRPSDASGEEPAPPLGYYETRRRKERIKSVLARIGALGLARSALRALDWLASQRWSPLYGLGEQLILIAVKRV